MENVNQKSGFFSKDNDLKNRIFFTIFVLSIYRLGTYIPLPGIDAQSDEQLNEYIRSKAETAYHPCGTLKMGTDKMAVVDENLRIHELQNIRVVDASVMPEIPSANLNAPTLMVAEKASDIIINAD